MSVGVSILERGTIRIRPSHRNQSATKPVLVRRAKVIFGDPNWTQPLPINTYLIQHSDGPILFDTGESPHASEKGGLPWWHLFLQLSVDINVAPDEAIRARLAQQELSPKDLQAVVVSHLHHDHSDGLADLASARILVSAEHWDSYRKRFRAAIEGGAPRYWPADFQPELLHLTGPALGPWERTFPITNDGKVVGVPTPGHIPVHLSVVVFGDDATYLLGGDVTYDQDLLGQEETDGVNSQPRLAVEQLRKIKTFAAMQPIVLLPAHDPNAASRLARTTIYHPSPMKPGR